MSTLVDSAVDLDGVQVLTAPLDPMRPADIVVPEGIRSVPPCCPLCFMLLHAVNMNDRGDLLFECLIDGYQAVYRVATRLWDPRPGHTPRRWTEPLTRSEAAVRFKAAQDTSPGP